MSRMVTAICGNSYNMPEICGYAEEITAIYIFVLIVQVTRGVEEDWKWVEGSQRYFQPKLIASFVSTVD